MQIWVRSFQDSKTCALNTKHCDDATWTGDLACCPASCPALCNPVTEINTQDKPSGCLYKDGTDMYFNVNSTSTAGFGSDWGADVGVVCKNDEGSGWGMYYGGGETNDYKQVG